MSTQTGIIQFDEARNLELEVDYMLGELSDLWLLSGIIDNKMDWQHRALVYEGMIKKLSPKHAKE